LTGLFDIYGFVSVLIHGLDLVAQTVLAGSVAFALLTATASSGSTANGLQVETTRRIIVIAASATMATTVIATAVSYLILRETLDLSPETIGGARFVIEGGARFLSAAGVLAIVALRPLSDRFTRIGIGVLASIILLAAAANSRGAARLENSDVLCAATLAHQLGAALVALGATLLLTHSHALGNVKEELLPLCFIVIGLLLLGYREA
jgi:copper resistance protein D